MDIYFNEQRQEFFNTVNIQIKKSTFNFIFADEFVYQ